MDIAGKGISVPISPRSMVDSVADWPLCQVVEHIKKKERESGHVPVERSFLHGRSNIKHLATVIDELAARYGVSRNLMCRCVSYHGISFAERDITVTKLANLYAFVRRSALQTDDTDTLDKLRALGAYAPLTVDDTESWYQLYEPWVGDKFKEIAEVCGVWKYHLAQVFMLKSILTDDTDSIQGTFPRLQGETARWDSWMAARLDALQLLANKFDSGGR